MPTAYTADISKGITFKEYALLCARNFGATITMRDEPLDAEIPEFKPSDYHVKRIYEIQKEINTLENLTKDGVIQYAHQEYLDELRNARTHNDAVKNLETKYKGMLVVVSLWTPPTEDHIRLKEFMLEQLETSIKYDCNHFYDIDDIVQKDADEWLNDKISSLYKSLSYSADEYTKEVERTNDRNKWVKALRDSL